MSVHPVVQPAIRLDRLTKHYGDRVAVDAMSVEVAPGELFGFLGPNGAGKTTSIKMLVGLVRPTLGRALLCGFDVVDEPLQARAVAGYCPDQPALYDKLSGREMLRLSADLYGVSRAVQNARIDPMLETFALAGHADELIQSYSRGMKQKLSLCAALIHDPRVLFLDEPTVGLDPAGARQLRDVLRRLCDQGRTVFLSTHSLGVAEALCDRVGIVQNGRLLVVGAPSQLRSGRDTSLEDTFLRLTGGDGGEEDAGPLLRALRS
ncbi:MAG: ABC transporter ATP-binding protein [Candidatus Dormibacteria bacterium]